MSMQASVVRETMSTSSHQSPERVARGQTRDSEAEVRNQLLGALPQRRQYSTGACNDCVLSRSCRLSSVKLRVLLLLLTLDSHHQRLCRKCPPSCHTPRTPRKRSPTTSSRYGSRSHAAGHHAAWDAEHALRTRPQVLRLQYQKELSQSHVTVQTKFNYAWGLVKSPLREHQVEGVRLLQGASSYP